MTLKTKIGKQLKEVLDQNTKLKEENKQLRKTNQDLHGRLNSISEYLKQGKIDVKNNQEVQTEVRSSSQARGIAKVMGVEK